ncbi:hypothetical protein GCM10023079_31720 [Streptomyces chitinivorans]
MVEDGARDLVAGAVVLVRGRVAVGAGVTAALVGRHVLSRLLTPPRVRSAPARRGRAAGDGGALFHNAIVA